MGLSAAVVHKKIIGCLAAYESAEFSMREINLETYPNFLCMAGNELISLQLIVFFSYRNLLCKTLFRSSISSRSIT